MQNILWDISMVEGISWDLTFQEPPGDPCPAVWQTTDSVQGMSGAQKLLSIWISLCQAYGMIWLGGGGGGGGGEMEDKAEIFSINDDEKSMSNFHEHKTCDFMLVD